MERSASRRTALGSVAAGASMLVSGCVGVPKVGGQPDTIPVEIVNETDTAHEYAVEVTTPEEGTLLSKEGTVDAGGTVSSSFELGDPNATYRVDASASGSGDTRDVGGSGLRDIRVVVGSGPSVDVLVGRT